MEQQLLLIEALRAEVQAVRAELASVQQTATAAGQAAEAAGRAGGTQSGGDQRHTFRRIDFMKDLKPSVFAGDGSDKNGFKTWALKTGVFLTNAELDSCYQEQMDWAARFTREITSGEYGEKARMANWVGPDGCDHIRCGSQLFRYLVANTEGTALRLVQAGTWGDGVNAWRRLAQHFDPVSMAKSQEYLKMILSLPRSESIDEARVLVQKLEDAIRKYEDCVGDRLR